MTIETLQAAIAGLKYQKQNIDAQVAALESELQALQPTGKWEAVSEWRAVAEPKKTRKRRTLKAKQGEASAVVHELHKKRNLSAVARKRIAEATRKRWAAYRAAKGITGNGRLKKKAA